MNGEWVILIWTLISVIFLVKIPSVRELFANVRKMSAIGIICMVLSLGFLANVSYTKDGVSTNETTSQTISLSVENSSTPTQSSTSTRTGLPDFWKDDPTDTDEDGIPDLWEKWTHGNRAIADGDLDRDGDGLTDLEEFLNQTDPRTADTDGDSFSDAFEIANGMNPVSAEDFIPIEPDTNHNGVPDMWEQIGYSDTFHDANGNGFDDTYERYYIPAASDDNFDVLVDVYTTRSATLNWTSGENRMTILILPTTGTFVKIRLPFGSDTELYLQSSPYGTDLPSGELWKSRMRISFVPRTGQNLNGNALISSEGVIAHKVVNVENVIVRFPEPLSARGVQTQSLTSGNSDGPNTDIKAGKFEVFCADLYHGVGDVVGPLTVTTLLGMESATYDWSSTYGSMSPDSGSESWLTVTRLPASQDEKMSVVTTAELDSQSHVAITSIVEQCSQRMFSASFSTDNFSPQLGETLGIGVTLPGCIHEINPGWLEIEVVREVIGAMQHVASVDMDISTSTVDRYLDTSTLGGQTLPFAWDGLAQVSLPLADHPDVFNGSKGRSIHRAMPSIEADEPVPPPFCTVRVRLWNLGKTEVLNEYSETVFIPQVVKISFLSNVPSLLATPLVYTNADNSATIVYAGTEDEAAAEQILLDMPRYIMAFMPDDVNIRFVNAEQPVSGSYTGFFLTKMPSPIDDVLGACFGLDQRNSTPIGLGVIYAYDTHETIREYYRYRDVVGDVFTVPLSGSAFANLLALISVHEVAHALGLVDPDVLDAFSIEDPHNLNGAGQNIMDSCAMQRMSDILSPSKTRYWRRNNRHYMEFCLPKKKWGFL